MTRANSYLGKIMSLAPIMDADRIEAATVVAGIGGKWNGVVKKGEFKQGDVSFFCIRKHTPGADVP